jgi:hypothetical protein
MTNLDDKIGRVAESHLLVALNRIITPLLLGLMAFLGVQVWNDIADIGSDVTDIKINQAISKTKLEEMEKRLDRFERRAPRERADLP